LNTVVYAATAGLLAIVVGFLLAFLVGRSARLRTLCLALVVVLFSLPPALPALGLIQMASFSPAWTDPLLRSRLTVGLALGIRFLPIATVLALQAWANTSPTWSQAAAIHGLPLRRVLGRIFLPYLVPTGALAALLVALLASADVSTQLMLHPPGQRSFPLVIFTVMSNAPQSLVASLCFLYIAAAGILLFLLSLAGRVRP
jgi:ABC-type Fe3+ transport system permease subunit